MGVLSTYGELKSELGSRSGRSANTTWLAAVPLFIRRAHDTLMRELTIPLLTTTADLTINAERVALPTDFRAVERLFIDGAYDSPLTPTSVELRVREAVTQPTNRPRVFSVEGGYLAFAPAPDTTYTGKLLYKRSLPFFSADSDTNDLLVRYPFSYLYGAMAEAAAWDAYDEDQAKYESMFRAEIAQINAAEQANAYGGGTLMPMPSGGVA
jgi:hypothetical protein